MAINLSTPNEELIRTLNSENKKALYWFRKQHGGDKGFQKLRDDLLYKCAISKKNELSDVVEYISPSGNRWRIFECARYFKDAEGVYTNTWAFIYYETYGSCGAFVPINGDEGKKECGCLIYTSHFFERFCERLSVPYKSSAMIATFLEYVPMQIISIRDDFENGNYRKVDVGLPASVGRGVIKQLEPSIIEVRSFLTNSQLSKKQLKETENLRNAQAKVKYEPMDVTIAKGIKAGNLYDFVYEQIDKNVALGVPREIGENLGTISIGASYVMLELGYISETDLKTSRRFGEITRDRAIDAAYRTYSEDKFPWVNMYMEALTLCRYGAKRIGLRNVDYHKVADKLMDVFQINKADYDIDKLVAYMDAYDEKIEEHEKYLEANKKEFKCKRS